MIITCQKRKKDYRSITQFSLQLRLQREEYMTKSKPPTQPKLNSFEKHYIAVNQDWHIRLEE